MATSNHGAKKKKMEKKAVVNVPDDLIVQILLRVPARYLSQLRWACKYWYNLITNDPSFIKLHLEHSDQVIADNISILLLDRHRNILQVNRIQGDTVSSPIWETKSLGFRLWGSSCNGLLCVQMLKINAICLWNPCTDELRRIPTIPDSLLHTDKHICKSAYGLGYCPNIDDYKIVRKIMKRTRFGCSLGSLEIYSLRTNSWKTVYNGDDPYKYYYGWSHGVGVHLNGSLYFSLGDRNVVCFDVEKEEYRQLSMPIWTTIHILMAIGELQGCLCLLKSNPNVVEVWMTKDCGRTKENWVKSFTIMNLMVQETLTQGYYSYTLMKFNKNGEFLLKHSNNSELFWYNLEADKSRQVAEVPNSWFQAETYTDTLVSLNPSVYMC